MKALAFATLAALTFAPLTLTAQTWAPGVVVDGDVSEWDGQVPAAITDVSGDGGTGRDIQAIYLANDATNLYVRVQSFNADGFDGNELGGVDGDNSNTTGFDLFGSTRGSDLLIAGASLFGQTTGSFNNGAATPASITFRPFIASTDIEFSVPLNTTMPGDIASAFPGGLGSTIGFIYGDSNGGAGDAESMDYTLATAPTVTPTTTIDDMSLFTDAATAAFRTRDTSSNVALSYTLDGLPTGGPTGDAALEATHSLDASLPFDVSQIAHRFIAPIDITGHTDVILDFFGAPGLASANVWVGLIDIDGDYVAITLPPTDTAAWSEISLGLVSGWFTQAPVAPGGDATFDADQIIEYRLGLQPGTAATGNYTVRYGNLRTSTSTSVQDWQLMN